MRAFIKALGESWPVLAGIGGILIFVGVLSTRVDIHTEQIKEEKAVREKLAESLGAEQKETLRVVNQIAIDVAVMRARQEAQASR